MEDAPQSAPALAFTNRCAGHAQRHGSMSWLDAIPPDAIPQFHCPFRAAPCLMAFAVEVLQL